MKDLEKAIKKEQEYLSYRMKDEEPFHFIDAVKECGFESIDEYFKAKKLQKFQALSFEKIETNPLEAIPQALEIVKNKKTAIFFADTLFTIIWNGNGSEYNKEYCIEHSIPIIPFQTGGGTIVSTKGDLNIGICFPKEFDYSIDDILNGFTNIFRKYTDKKIEVQGNDIIIDDYKVMGSAVYKSSTMLLFMTSISMSDKSEIIENVCLKQSKKIPGYIDFMSNKELRQEVVEWLQIK